MGCLLMLLLFAAVIYFGSDIAEVYFRYYRFNDAVQREAQYGSTRTNEEIKGRLVAFADSLGLPDEAGQQLEVRRSANRLVIETSYSDSIKTPFHKREIRFTPSADVRF